MTKQEVINKVISIAKNELGYLEKASNNNLYSKTENAGRNNYTKYWAEIKPEYQGQPWCACYVTWVFVKAFGVEMTSKLLRHYPYVYCPTMADLFTLNPNPKVGDIVIFKRNGTFTHTGLVTYVSGDYFETMEGNTSSGSTIVANGGGVCNKSYYNSNLPGTKFITVDWDLVSKPSHWAKEYLDKLVDKKYIKDKEIWSFYELPTSKALAIALIDNVTGGLWKSEEDDTSIHWAQPNVISLCGKKIISDKSQWLSSLNVPISNSLLLALVDKATGGMKQKYINRTTDHWGRNHLDSLCDKGIITTPDAWTDFEADVTRANCMALICKAFIK